MTKNTKAKTSPINGKKGGRPLGAKTLAALERDIVLKEFKDKVMHSVNVLFNAQLHIATGQTYLYKIEKELQIGLKGGKKYVNSSPTLVINPDEIETYLQGLIDCGNMEAKDDPNPTYYYITTKDPDNKAIDSLLDRTFDKPKQAVGMEHVGEIEVYTAKRPTAGDIAAKRAYEATEYGITE